MANQGQWSAPSIWPDTEDHTIGLQKELPYPLLSDPKRVLIRALGAGEGGKTKRSHFVFEKGGKLLDKKIPVKAADRYATFASLNSCILILMLLSQPEARAGVCEKPVRLR